MTAHSLIAVIMGSKSDLPIMQHCCDRLADLNISYDKYIISAHRTPERLYEFAKNAHSKRFKLIIAGAGGAAHLPGMVASLSILPVLGVPIESKLSGLDSLLSIVQMPAGVPVACLAVGKAGAINAAMLSASILSLNDKLIEEKLRSFREEMTKSIPLIP